MGQDGMGLGGLVRGDWGWMEDEDGVLVGKGVQEVTVRLEAEQEVEEGDGEQAEVVVQGVAGVVGEGCNGSRW